MAASLLADIDWTSLSSAELTTAVKLLCTALQERYAVACINIDGSGGGSGRNLFPYGGNNPRWSLSPGSPLANYTDSNLADSENLNELLKYTASKYADIDRWNDAATNGDSGDTLFSLAQTDTDDPQYETRLLEVTGYTSFPDFTIITAYEVKKLYDMIKALRYVIRYPQATIRSNVHRIFEGEFNVNQSAFFVVEDPEGDGANYYKGDAFGSIMSDGVSYADFKVGNSNLFGSTTSTFDESVDSGTHEPPFYNGIDNPYYVWFRRFKAGDEKYTNFIKAFQVKYVIDWSVPQGIQGFTGRPIAYMSQNIITSLVNSFPAGHDTNFQYPGTTTGISQRYWETVTLSNNGEVDTVKRDNLLTGVTLPATQTSIANNQSIEVEPTMSSLLSSIHLEDWDGDGGFEYYTPP